MFFKIQYNHDVLLINENYGGPKEVLQCKSVFAKDLSTSIKIANSIRKIKDNNTNIFFWGELLHAHNKMRTLCLGF